MPNFQAVTSLITILTDLPLIPDIPSKNQCGTCKECVRACPINALIDINFDDHPEKLEKSFNVTKCGPWIDKTWYKGKICYNCMLACPWGKQEAKSE